MADVHLLVSFFYLHHGASSDKHRYMGALSNSGRRAANFTGFYKGIQSAGAAVFWRLDGLKKPYNTMFGASWGLLAGALVFAAPVIWMKIQDTVPLEEDLKHTDETVGDVAPTKEQDV